MRVTSLLITGLFALAANAQSNTPAPSSSPTIDPATAAANSQQAEIIKCINACEAGDVNCTSKCISVPNPNEKAVEETNKCVNACPKGNGTEADNLNYANCRDGCIGKYYWAPTASGVPGASQTGAPNGAASSGSGTNAVTTGPSGTADNEEASRTGTAAASSSSAAGEVLRPVAGMGLGAVGFLAAILAL
ncbi:hypothetical protein QBC35DRAFT_469188 [Podospora australis]|uniref:Uncharacterized protein n=1 Tax=Podospora australis TaxID=1536484 RepID=A0AAN6X419_9PEZI|nr:hypothetical protein QBC35DRAFT_469188 [Podospora australis]